MTLWSLTWRCALFGLRAVQRMLVSAEWGRVSLVVELGTETGFLRESDWDRMLFLSSI
jgi:hypothetical protein